MLKKFIIKNKKRTLTSLIGVLLATLCLISVAIIFSSFRGFLIENVKISTGDYHVILKADLENYTNENIEKIEFSSGRYYITYKNIKKTYDLTKDICKTHTCEVITYNDKLLSLYGMSLNENVLQTFKNIFLILTTVLSITLFLVVYNSFKVSLFKRKKEIYLLKLSGARNIDLFKLFLFEGFLLSIIGIILGFLLSLIFSSILINIINNLLYELLNNNLKLVLDGNFIFISILFLIIITFFSCLLPLKYIKRDEIIYDEHISFNTFYSFAILNYKRNKKRYRSLIVGIFIFAFAFNFLNIILNYTLNTIDDYVLRPEYDLMVSSKEDISYIISDLEALESNYFKRCDFEKGFEDMDVMVTNLVGNNFIGLVDMVTGEDRLARVKYERFKDLKEITLNNVNLNLKFTNEVPFGFSDLLNKNNLIINLDDDNFNKVCPRYDNILYLNTDYRGLDDYLKEEILENEKIEISYFNVKKMNEIIDNTILAVKLVCYGVVFLILIVTFVSLFSTLTLSISLRKREFALLNVMGLTKGKINICLLIESLIIAFKGVIYSVPFIFIFNKLVYESVNSLFKINLIIDYGSLFLTFLIVFLGVYVVMVLMHLSLYSKSLVYNINFECD